MVISGGQDKPKKTTSWHYLRLLLTDSGHYLPPVDDTRGVSGHTKDEIEKQMFTWYQGFQNKRNDVRHCFLPVRLLLSPQEVEIRVIFILKISCFPFARSKPLTLKEFPLFVPRLTKMQNVWFRSMI